jgi:hypothetical protein
MLRPSYFLSDLHRGLRASCETFSEKPNDAQSSLSVSKKEASALVVGEMLGNHLWHGLERLSALVRFVERPGGKNIFTIQQ